MPKIYLSPSTQEFNVYYADGDPDDEFNNEEYYMNLIADAMAPYLLANDIQFMMNLPEMSVDEIINESNSYAPDLHVSIHSNASPGGYEGVIQGPNIFYYPGSVDGERAANIVSDEFREIYPNPDLTIVLPEGNLAELRETVAPAVYVEVAYHDNPSDAAWIKNNIEAIARALSLAVAEYFGISFVEPSEFTLGEVSIKSGTLNVRNEPNGDSRIVGSLGNGRLVIILRVVPGWYLISTNEITGYVDSKYITVL